MKFTALAIAAFAAVAVAQDDGGLDALKSQYPQYFSGVTSLSVPSQYQTAAPQQPQQPAPAPQQPSAAPAPPAPAPPAPAPSQQQPAPAPPAPAPAATTAAPAPAPAPSKGNGGGYQLPPNFSSLLTNGGAEPAKPTGYQLPPNFSSLLPQEKKSGYQLPPNFSSLLTQQAAEEAAKPTGYQLPPNFSSLLSAVPTDAPSEADVTGAGNIPLVIPSALPLAEGQSGDENFGDLESLFSSFSGNLDNIQE